MSAGASAVAPSARLVPPGGRVCIIGGGTTGLLAAKNCLDEGLEPTVFERTARVGGVWRLDEEPSRVAYESLYTNSSGCLMNISDYPLQDDLQGQFPRRQDICAYYEGYAGAFSLERRIRFQTEVVSVRREGGVWAVTSQQSAPGGRREEHHFHAIFVCTGQFHKPSAPPLPGVESFEGRVRHSASYRRGEDLRGKRVVIVGIGNSALDISLEAARSGCHSVVVLCRSGTNVIPVADYYGRPADQMLNTRLFQALPSAVRNLLFFQLVRGTTRKFRQHGMPPPPKGKDSVGFANLKEHVEYRKLLESGRIQFAAGGLAALRGRRVVTTEGEELEADEVILCTGYHLTFPFLDGDLAGSFLARSAGGKPHLNAYKLVMHPEEPTLCALSFLLTFGNESCVGEMQARWALAHWVGRRPLPTSEEIEADLARRRSKGKYPQFVRYISYMDALSAACGSSPDTSWHALLRSPRLFWKLWCSPVVPAQFRISGSHAWPQATDFVRSQPSMALRMAELLWAPPDSKSARPAAPPVPASRL